MTRYEWLKAQLALPINPDECLIWPYAATGKGYGSLSIKGKNYRVSRVVWKLVTGKDPDPLLVIRHLCNTRRCFNPHHLLEGTWEENEEDKTLCGSKRIARGELHFNSILTTLQVQEIRNSQLPTQVLCDRFGIAPRTVQSVRAGHSWKHLNG